MNKLLHIIATPRQDESRTLKVSGAFLTKFKSAHPECVVEELDLFKEKLPELTVKRVNGKYVLLSGKDLSGDFKEAWEEIIAHIEKFLSADGYLISTPMWNFSIPYKLKHYIDIIVQPRYLFKYAASGVEGIAKGRRMVIITSRGGDYSAGPARGLDHQEPYLRTLFGFVGVTDIAFINSQPMDAQGEVAQKQKIAEAQKAAEKLAEAF